MNDVFSAIWPGPKEAFWLFLVPALKSTARYENSPLMLLSFYGPPLTQY